MSLFRYSGSSNFYRELAEFPVPVSAKFTAPTSDFAVVRVSYSVRDHERNVKQSISKAFTLYGPDYMPNVPHTISHDPSDILAFLLAPSKIRHALLREVTDMNNAKKRCVEVWRGSQLEGSLDVTKLHGPFHTDDYFKSFSFAPSENALVYTAEANAPEDKENKDPFPKFRFTPHFGEQLHTRKRPTLFIFRWNRSRLLNEAPHNGDDHETPQTPSVSALSPDQPPQIPVVFGQAIFVSDTCLYATGYEQTGDGRLLGVKGCFNRPSSIWEIRLPDQVESSDGVTGTTMSCKFIKIEVPGRSCRSPRVLFQGKGHTPITLFWLSNPTGGAHASTVSLHVRDLKGDGGDRILVDAVWDPSPEEFPGLYTDCNLADSPFLRLLDGKTYMVVQSLWHSRQTLLSIDVESGAVVDLTPDPLPHHHERLFSWNLLATDGECSLICSRSTPTSPPETVLLTWSDKQLGPYFTVLDRPAMSAKLWKVVSQLNARVVPIPDRHPVETIVICSKEDAEHGRKKPFCLTIPHGGPHASSVTSFTPSVLACVLEGYTVSMPNYTGSTGFGEKHVQALIGKCGTLDVEDCIITVEELIRLGLSEHGRQIIQGGSHGGFLAAHLIGRYPDVFSAAVMRNPVISAGDLCTSDIPDWAPCEFGLGWGPGTHVVPEGFSGLYAASPIAHVDRVFGKDDTNESDLKTATIQKMPPVLLLLGEDDLRVPPTQGKGYYHALKGRGAMVDLLMFPKETHPIDGVEAARVAFEAGRDWFRAFTEQQRE